MPRLHQLATWRHPSEYSEFPDENCLGRMMILAVIRFNVILDLVMPGMFNKGKNKKIVANVREHYSG